MYFVIGHSFSQVMNQVAAISKKLKDITRENADIKDDVKEISQFLTENNLSVVKDKINHFTGNNLIFRIIQDIKAIQDTKIPLIFGMDGNILQTEVLATQLQEE